MGFDKNARNFGKFTREPTKFEFWVDFKRFGNVEWVILIYVIIKYKV
jgi:hypothetical protein